MKCKHTGRKIVSPLDMLPEKEQRSLEIVYEFIFAEYAKEKRKIKHCDPARLCWMRSHLKRYQIILKKLCPGKKFEFTKL